MSTSQQDKLHLIAAARKLAGMLKLSDHGAMMRIRMPSRPSNPETDGWRIVIGNLGEGQPRLELWLDRFSGYSERKFMACLFSEDRAQLSKITRRVARSLWPFRTITLKDTEDGKFFALSKRLDRSELAKPILEKYETETFFGIYDPATRRSEQATSRFLNSAAAFFIEVAESLPKAKGRSIGREDFPRCEDRKWVQAHLARERSGYLAAECKNRLSLPNLRFSFC
jgi:hypothetical protein